MRAAAAALARFSCPLAPRNARAGSRRCFGPNVCQTIFAESRPRLEPQVSSTVNSRNRNPSLIADLSLRLTRRSGAVQRASRLNQRSRRQGRWHQHCENEEGTFDASVNCTERGVGLRPCDGCQCRYSRCADRRCRRLGHQSRGRMRTGILARARRALSSVCGRSRVPARVSPWRRGPAVLAELNAQRHLGLN